MEINFTKIVAALGLLAGGAAIGKLASQSSIDLQKAKLVDEARHLEGTVLLLKNANREYVGDMSNREEALNMAILDDSHSELKAFQLRNKPATDKAAEAVNDGVDTGINVVGRVWGGVKSLFKRKDKTEVTSDQGEPAVAS